MHRLFVAIRPPRAVRAHLMAAMGRVAGARWQDDDQLHLTLRFIGEVERPLADDIALALHAVRSPRFELALNGVGRFDTKSRNAAIWAGVAPHAPLEALHKKVNRALQSASVSSDTRAYLPHITLARLSRTDAALLDHAALPAISPLRFTVDAFALYESELTRDGAVYHLVERYALV